ncbi:hypothetical protein, partial [Mesorhizobium sp. SARCC-RB16n]|uniref:hypothetical protein n=1 Tax=Mesorhizobium sp. SARCC-RB16n TaxID=2116687 RepID=UPI001AEE0A2C
MEKNRALRGPAKYEGRNLRRERIHRVEGKHSMRCFVKTSSATIQDRKITSGKHHATVIVCRRRYSSLIERTDYWRADVIFVDSLFSAVGREQGGRVPSGSLIASVNALLP